MKFLECLYISNLKERSVKYFIAMLLTSGITDKVTKMLGKSDRSQ